MMHYYPQGLKPPPFLNCGTKSVQEIHDAILEGTGLRVGLLGDLLFKVTTVTALREYCRWWRKEHSWLKYEAHFLDCDDLAAAFHGDISKWDGWSATPNGIVWSAYLGGHAYNLHVALEAMLRPILRVYLIEPQTGEVAEVAAEHFEQFAPWLLMVNGKVGAADPEDVNWQDIAYGPMTAGTNITQ